MAKLSDVYGITKAAVAKSVEVKADRTVLRPKTIPELTIAVAQIEAEDNSIKFVLKISKKLALNLEIARAKRGLRSRSETIRALLGEALK